MGVCHVCLVRCNVLVFVRRVSATMSLKTNMYTNDETMHINTLNVKFIDILIICTFCDTRTYDTSIFTGGTISFDWLLIDGETLLPQSLSTFENKIILQIAHINLTFCVLYTFCVYIFVINSRFYSLYDFVMTCLNEIANLMVVFVQFLFSNIQIW